MVLFRTFSKAYGLAGFRVGYAVAQPDVAAALRAVSLPFGVSAVAQAAAIASLAAEAELLERVDALVAERDRVAAGLRDAGWDVPEAQGNFFWFALGERTADFAAAADERGIVVRPFAGEGCRVSVGEVEANDRLVELAETFAVRLEDCPSRSRSSTNHLRVRPPGDGHPARRAAAAGAALPDADRGVLARGQPEEPLHQLAAGPVRQLGGPARLPREDRRRSRSPSAWSPT